MVFGAFLSNMYQELCCPVRARARWEPAAFASFFADYARPRTVTRFRYDNLENMIKPDRNQFWIMSATPSRTNSSAKFGIQPQMRLQQGYLYQEIAAGQAAFSGDPLSANQSELHAVTVWIQRHQLRYQVTLL